MPRTTKKKEKPNSKLALCNLLKYIPKNKLSLAASSKLRRQYAFSEVKSPMRTPAIVYRFPKTRTKLKGRASVI